LCSILSNWPFKSSPSLLKNFKSTKIPLLLIFSKTGVTSKSSFAVRGDGEEVSSGVAAGATAIEDAPEETEPAGPSSEEAKPEGEKDEGSA